VLFALTRRWAVAALAVALGWLSVDEAADLHERMGRYIEDRGVSLPLVQDLDSLVLAIYGAIFLLTVWAARSSVLSLRPARLAFVAAGFFGALALGFDMLVPRRFVWAHSEEYFEMLSAAAVAVMSLPHLAARLAQARRHATPLEAVGIERASGAQAPE
jgi:hypothetical protein